MFCCDNIWEAELAKQFDVILKKNQINMLRITEPFLIEHKKTFNICLRYPKMMPTI